MTEPHGPALGVEGGVGVGLAGVARRRLALGLREVRAEHHELAGRAREQGEQPGEGVAGDALHHPVPGLVPVVDEAWRPVEVVGAYPQHARVEVVGGRARRGRLSRVEATGAADAPPGREEGVRQADPDPAGPAGDVLVPHDLDADPDVTGGEGVQGAWRARRERGVADSRAEDGPPDLGVGEPGGVGLHAEFEDAAHRDVRRAGDLVRGGRGDVEDPPRGWAA